MTARRPARPAAPDGPPAAPPRETIALARMAHGGEAVGIAADGRTAFVAGGLPGEVVAVAFTADRPRFRRGYAAGPPAAPSPDRVAPRCPHFGAWPARGEAPGAWCGGCQWQHAASDAQRAFKRAALADALARIAGVASPAVAPMIAGPSDYGYRNKLRTRLSGGRPALVAASGADLVALDVCPIADPGLWDLVAGFEADLPDGTPVTFRIGTRTGDALVVIDDPDGHVGEIDIDAAASVVVVDADGTPTVAAGRSFYVERYRGAAIGVPATAFFQVNTDVAELLAAEVSDAVGGAGRVVDAYCGIGTLTGAIAEAAGEVVAIDSDGAAIAAAVDNLAGRANVTLVEGDAAEALAELGGGVDAVVVDPPRGGLSTAAGGWLARHRPPVVVYVSCEPSTLARDVKALVAAGYAHVRTTPLDMFPQTYHAESVTVLARRGASLARGGGIG